MEEQEQKSMSFLGHLEELRWRLVWSVIAVFAVAVVIFIYTPWITKNIFLELANPDFPIFKFFCWSIDVCATEIKIKWQSVEMMGQFGTQLLLSIIGGVVVAFPWIFYQIWSFVKPGLKQKEARAVRGIVFFVSVLFFVGISFGYFVIAPLTVQFFGNWQMDEDIKNQITINSYLKTIISTVFFTGLLFLLPVVIMIFSKLGIITAKWLKKYRKHSFVAVLILSAIITPPDLFTQIIVSIPIVLLYEFGIQIAKRVEKKRYKASVQDQ
jgi:sec-independent protein translocase protein TatC